MGKETPWLGIAEARQKLNVREIPGAADNPHIVSRYELCGWGKEVKKGIIKETTPWCAAEVGGDLVEAGYPIPPKAVNLSARSYLSYGRKLDKPERGAIGVMPRGSDPTLGHVFFILSYDEATGIMETHEGNVGNAIVRGRRHVSCLLKNGIRWPVAATIADLRTAGSTEIAHYDQAQIVSAGGTLATATVAAGEAVKAAPVTPGDAAFLPWDQMTEMTKNIGITDAFVNALLGLVRLLWAPWLLPALAICWLLWRYGAVGKLARLMRHVQGQPLSSQVYIPPEDEGDDVVSIPEAEPA